LWILRCQAAIAIGQDPDCKHVLTFEPKSSPTASAEWRHDFYHSATHVVLVVYMSNLTAEQVEVLFEPRRVTIRILHKDPVVLPFKLEQPIIPQLSKYVLSATKIEVKMAKAQPGPKQWHVQPEQ
jgi:hypothetical protein